MQRPRILSALPASWVFAVAVTGAAVLLALSAMLWHRPTRVELTLTVDRMAFTVAPGPTGEDAATLIDWGLISAVRIDRVARVDWRSDTLEVADEARFDLKANRFPDAAWRSLPTTGEVVLEPLPSPAGVAGAAAVALQAQDHASPGIVKLVRAPAGTDAVLELGREAAGRQPWLTLDLGAAPGADRPRVVLVFPARFLLFADNLALSGAPTVDSVGTQAPNAPPDTLSLRAGGDTNTQVTIQGSARGLVLQVEPAGSADTLLCEVQIPVRSVDFTRQDPGGERRSSLIGPGTLSYPDLPGKEALRLTAGEQVSLDGLAKARIKSLGLSDEGGRIGLKLTLDTVAAQVHVGTPEQPQDARLTWFDWFWYQPKLAILYLIVTAVFASAHQGYTKWQEFRSHAGAS